MILPAAPACACAWLTQHPGTQGTRHAGHRLCGLNVANPTAMLLASVNMLQHIGLADKSRAIKSAVDRVIAGGKVRV